MDRETREFIEILINEIDKIKERIQWMDERIDYLEETIMRIQFDD